MRGDGPGRREPAPAWGVALPTPVSLRATRRQETPVRSTDMTDLRLCGCADPRCTPCCSRYNCTTKIAFEPSQTAQEPREGQDDSQHVQRPAWRLDAGSML